MNITELVREHFYNTLRWYEVPTTDTLMGMYDRFAVHDSISDLNGFIERVFESHGITEMR